MHHITIGYIDDMYLHCKTYEKCAINIMNSIQMFDRLGLVIHPDNSVVIPQQRLTLIFLDFVSDSVNMIVI